MPALGHKYCWCKLSLPICDWAIMVALRSQSGEKGRQSSISLSPWRRHGYQNNMASWIFPNKAYSVNFSWMRGDGVKEKDIYKLNRYRSNDEYDWQHFSSRALYSSAAVLHPQPVYQQQSGGQRLDTWTIPQPPHVRWPRLVRHIANTNRLFAQNEYWLIKRKILVSLIQLLWYTLLLLLLCA